MATISMATMTNKMSDGKENNADESFKWSHGDVQLLLETFQLNLRAFAVFDDIVAHLPLTR